MRKISYIIVLLIMVTLCGCSKENDISKKYDYDIYEWPGIGYLSDSYSNNQDHITLIKDYDSYQKYIDSFPDEILNEEFSVDLLGYEESFFNENMLIILMHWEGTSSSVVSLNEIVYKESNIEVVLKRFMPNGHTDMMKDYGIIIRIPRDDKYATVNCSVIEEYEKKWYE